MKIGEVQAATSRNDFVEMLTGRGACDPAVVWARNEFDEHATAYEIWEKCRNPYWMLWLIEGLGKPGYSRDYHWLKAFEIDDSGEQSVGSLPVEVAPHRIIRHLTSAR